MHIQDQLARVEQGLRVHEAHLAALERRVYEIQQEGLMTEAAAFDLTNSLRIKQANANQLLELLDQAREELAR